MILFIYQIQTAIVVLYKCIMEHLSRLDHRTKFQEFILDTTTKISTTPIRVEMLDKSQVDKPDIKIPAFVGPIPMDAIMLAFNGYLTGEEFAGKDEDKEKFMSLWKEFQRVAQTDTEQLVDLAVDCVVERLREIGYWIACALTLVLGVGSWYVYLTSPSMLARSIAVALFTYGMTASLLFMVCWVLRVPAMRRPLDFYQTRRHPVIFENDDNIIKVTIQ